MLSRKRLRRCSHSLPLTMRKTSPATCIRATAEKPQEGWPAGKQCIFLERLRDRKSTRLNSSHQIISYAVFCLKKKKRNTPVQCTPKPPNPGAKSTCTQSQAASQHRHARATLPNMSEVVRA